MTNDNKHLLNEADIGSGEKSPGEQDTEKLIEEIGKDKTNAAPRPGTKQPHSTGGKTNSVPK